MNGDCFALTERGRVAALAIRLRASRPLVACGVAAIAERWPELSTEQQAEALELVDRLAAAVRRRPAVEPPHEPACPCDSCGDELDARLGMGTDLHERHERGRVPLAASLVV